MAIYNGCEILRDGTKMIIEANGKYYATTSHVEAKMVERKITAAQIKQVIEQGITDISRSAVCVKDMQQLRSKD